jgi:2-dehydropantoate 2-reductase
MDEIRQVVIVGAGAMGCLFAARILEAGASVTLVDSNLERLADIERLGLELQDDAGTRTLRPLTSRAEDVSGPLDLVILFTKGLHTAAAVRSVAHLARLKPVALTLQNGLGNAEILAETFGAERVLKGTAHVPADLQPPNRVVSHGFTQADLGGHVPAAQALAPSVAQLLRRGGLQVEVREDIDAAVWNKLAFNAALNATAMISGSCNAALNNEPGRRIAAAVVLESVAVARAAGLRLDASDINETVLKALAGHPAHKASMLQDREAGRRTEIEFINGAIVRAGERYGVATPVNATLADLVRLIDAATASAKASG